MHDIHNFIHTLCFSIQSKRNSAYKNHINATEDKCTEIDQSLTLQTQRGSHQSSTNYKPLKLQLLYSIIKKKKPKPTLYKSNKSISKFLQIIGEAKKEGESLHTTKHPKLPTIRIKSINICEAFSKNRNNSLCAVNTKFPKNCERKKTSKLNLFIMGNRY